VHSSGNLYKKLYVDGRRCDPDCFYFQTWYDAISVGELRNFQIQRKGYGGTYNYFQYFDVNIGAGTARRTVRTRQFFRFGVLSWGAENASGTDGNPPVDLFIPRIYDIWFHRYGDASAQSPGLTNYTKVTSGPGLQAPHAGCSFGWNDPAEQLEGSGRC
jgi:hypothetical protein